MAHVRAIGLAVVVGTVLFCAEAVRADAITAGGITYSSAKIESVDAGNITFAYQGRRLTKPNTAATRVQVEDFDEFNDAERLLAEKKLDEARDAYVHARKKAKTDLQKDLVRFRAALATKPGGGAEPPGGKSTRISEGRCIYCGDTGRMRCPDCKGMGGAKCPDCRKGFASCSQCNAKGKIKCSRCEGEGKIAGRNWKNQIVYKPCSKCNGRAYDKCAACGKNKFPGYAACAKCDGTGLKGRCEPCGGGKTIPCSHCAAGRKLRDALPPRVVSKWPDSVTTTPSEKTVPEDAHTPATKPDDGTSVAAKEPPQEPKEPADPLASADAMIEELASCPMSPEKSSEFKALPADQQKAAREQYAKDLAEWTKTHEYRKQRVKWRLKFQAVGPGSKQDLLVLTETKSGAVVGLSIPLKDQSMIDALQKDQVIVVSATVLDYGSKDDKDDWFSVNQKPYDILVADATILDESGKAPASKPAEESLPTGPGPGF